MDRLEMARMALGKDPKNPDILTDVGRLHLARGEIWSARDVFRKAHRVAPDVVEFLDNLAVVELKTGRPDRALPLIDKSRKIVPRNAGSVKTQFETLMSLGHSDTARAVLDTVIKQGLNAPEVLLDLASAMTADGDFDAAEEVYLRLLEVDLPPSGAFWGLAKLSPNPATADWSERLSSLCEMPNLPMPDQIRLLQARAMLNDRRGDYAQAFADFARANRLFHPKERSTNSSYPALEALIDGSARGPLKQGSTARRPIFVFGMPRSGTTLVEQILASHPEVHGAGELSFFGLQARRWNDPQLDRARLTQLSKEYLKVLNAHDSNTKFIVDKMPSNFENLWLIARCFPNATFIHCRREPIATCTSLFTSPMGSAHSYLHGLDSLGHHYRWYEQVMAHWHHTLDIQIYEVGYESLVLDPEPNIRSLLAHVGLDWHAGCLEFWKTRRPVMTPSRTQVSRPIYRDAIEKWRRYEPFLAPLMAALGNSR